MQEPKLSVLRRLAWVPDAELVTPTMRVFAFDRSAAEVFGPLKAELEAEGHRLDEPDLRIGSICIARDLTLATGNIRHFSRVPRLRVENWLED